MADPRSLDSLTELLRGRRVAVLTGAGCSTESGIPDYRGPGTRERARNPIQHRAFLSDASVRARYWARSALGWPRFSAARPNGAHHALAALERAGQVVGLVTQNVDRLHHRAGSVDAIELHGALAEVRCLDCGAREPRDELQRRILELNPALDAAVRARAAELAPDGDADLDDDAVRGFRAPPCLACGGVLKPDVVFFGDNVPRPRVDRAHATLERGDALLVVGSSLTVFSGYRFVLRAAERGVPVAIVNLGPTRGDAHASLRVDGRASEILGAIARRLAT